MYKIGYLYYKLDSVTKAIYYYKKTTLLKSENPIKSGQAYCEIGKIYNDLNLLEESLIHYKKGINILEKENEPLWTESAIVSFTTKSHSNIKFEPSSFGFR